MFNSLCSLQISPLPAPLGSSLLDRYITKFGQRAVRQGPNRADGKVGMAVMFASNCHTPRYVVIIISKESIFGEIYCNITLQEFPSKRVLSGRIFKHLLK